jgi:hypothetical protein
VTQGGRGQGADDEAGDGLAEVLLALRLLGFASTEVIVAHPCGPESVASAEDALRRAAVRGWATQRTGRPTGWSLSTAGRVAGHRLLATEVSERGLREEFDAWYQAFLPLNARLLAVCTRWQLRTGADGREVVNDHVDVAHDERVIAELEALHADGAALLEGLAAALERFSTYGPRLERAVERVRRGDRDWFTRPMVDSYHTVWFELHEHLLATLGVTRHQERTGNSFVAPDPAE